jgi:hypothetical protein
VVHEELISLRRLALQRREVPFTQAFLAWQRDGQQLTWSGTVRGAALEGIVADGQEVSLSATSLDGRAVAGSVVVMRPEGLEALLAFAGSGPLLVEGREL